MKLALKLQRKKASWTQDVLSEKSGVSRPHIATIESDRMKKSPSIETLEALAGALGVRVGELFNDIKPVAIAGKVGAGARVPLIDAYAIGDGLYHVACPSELSGYSIVGVEVEGDSMVPTYRHGDVLFYSRDTVGVPTEALGAICVCEDDGGGGWVKHIKPGTEPGKFHLLSLNPLADNMFDIVLKWAAPVKLAWPRALVERI